MDDNEALHLLARAVLVSSELLMPVLLVALIIGVVVSILQAVTQIQEMTLTFAPLSTSENLVATSTVFRTLCGPRCVRPRELFWSAKCATVPRWKLR